MSPQEIRRIVESGLLQVGESGLPEKVRVVSVDMTGATLVAQRSNGQKESFAFWKKPGESFQVRRVESASHWIREAMAMNRSAR